MIKEIKKNNWDFTLYEVGKEFIISVVFFNSMIDFSRSFKLTDNEKVFQFEQLKELSENIRNNYDVYEEREIIPAITKEDLDS
jgi:predicted transcriptional regulator